MTWNSFAREEYGVEKAVSDLREIQYHDSKIYLSFPVFSTFGRRQTPHLWRPSLLKDYYQLISTSRRSWKIRTKLFNEYINTAFIKELRLPKNSNELITDLLGIMSNFFKGERLKHEITIQQTHDPEDDIAQIKMTVEIDDDFKHIYENLRPQIYKLAADALPSELVQSLVIDLRAMNQGFR
ncbi:MAG: hypothetical protein KGH57_00880 [Candidatus Micrarchaeota archaeon]|nr:hypothetical protein [Candidatus Micrarchaeota archaeon]